MTSKSGGGTTNGQPYFVDQKKGEVNELRMLLGKLTVQRDKKKMREVVKKVIAYMTIGIDVTRLFDQMVMACHTADLVIKKMVYLYLTHYAAANPGLAILGINTLCKDAGDADPMVRGLAIRSLTSLRLPTVVEYVMEPVRKGLRDHSPYVRKAAVMGVLKIHHLDPVLIAESDFVNQLYNMVRDADAKVVANCLVVLNEIMREEGGVAINKKLITYLLNRIQEFNEWGQTVVLSLVPKYTPRSDDEAFAFMNVLDGVLRTSNSGVALACTKCFVHFTENLDESIRRQAYMRIMSPLLTLMTGNCNETNWAVLKHVAALVRRQHGIFDEQYKAFYCRHNDPSHVQYIKLDILPQVANTGNMHDIIAELAEYVTDINMEVSRRSIIAVGQLAMRIPSSADNIMNQLLGFLDFDLEHVTDQTMVTMKNVLRKYPERAGDVSVVVNKCMEKASSPQGRSAVIWIYGEFGSLIQEAPYQLEKLINGLDTEPSTTVRLELLSATLKLFFQRPPEMQAMLGRLLQYFLDSEDLDPDLNDRTMMYYRMLTTNPDKCKTIVTPVRDAVQTFTEDEQDEVKQRIFKQFNTLSLVFGLPQEAFTDDQYITAEREEMDENDDAGGLLGGSGGDGGDGGGMMNNGTSDQMQQQPQDQQHVDSGNGMDDLLGFGGDGGGGGSQAPPAPQSSGGSDDDLLGMFAGNGGGGGSDGGSGGSNFQLVANATLSQAEFQQAWMNPQATGCAYAFTVQLGPSPDLPSMEQLLRGHNIQTLASGVVNGNIKVYLFGQNTAGTTYMCELLADQTGNGRGTCKVSTIQDPAVSQFAQLIEIALTGGNGVATQSAADDIMSLF